MNEGQYSSLSIKVLSSCTKERISLYLNVEDNFLSANGIARDYRGLAELLGLDYQQIRNLRRHENPTLKILKMWENQSNSTVGEFFKFLEKMDRGDVLLKCRPLIERDASTFLETQNSMQVPVAAPCASISLKPEDIHSPSVSDDCSRECIIYDAYICHADEDLDFVMWLTSFLESSGLKVFLPCRDLLGGHNMEQVALIQLIKDRCRRMLVILSPAFSESTSCVFQANFAANLAIEFVQRITIPIIIAPCEIPLILTTMSKIDLTKNSQVIQKWMLPKLILSIKNVDNSDYFSQINKNIVLRNEKCIQNGGVSSFQNNSSVEFPPSVSNFENSESIPASTFKFVSSACTSSAVASFNTSVPELCIQSVPVATRTELSLKDSGNVETANKSSKGSMRKHVRNYLKEIHSAVKERFSITNQSSRQVSSSANDLTGIP